MIRSLKSTRSFIIASSSARVLINSMHKLCDRLRAFNWVVKLSLWLRDTTTCGLVVGGGSRIDKAWLDVVAMAIEIIIVVIVDKLANSCDH